MVCVNGKKIMDGVVNLGTEGNVQWKREVADGVTNTFCWEGSITREATGSLEEI